MARDILKLTLALGILSALALGSSAALAASHPVGPFSKTELAQLCRLESGALTTSPGTWICEARRWTIDCVENGRLCVIDLLGSQSNDPNGRSIVASAGAPTGTGGGIGDFGVDKVDTSGLGMGPSDGAGGGDTITTNGDHHGSGVGLH